MSTKTKKKRPTYEEQKQLFEKLGFKMIEKRGLKEPRWVDDNGVRADVVSYGWNYQEQFRVELNIPYCDETRELRQHVVFPAFNEKSIRKALDRIAPLFEKARENEKKRAARVEAIKQRFTKLGCSVEYVELGKYSDRASVRVIKTALGEVEFDLAYDDEHIRAIVLSDSPKIDKVFDAVGGSDE